MQGGSSENNFLGCHALSVFPPQRLQAASLLRASRGLTLGLLEDPGGWGGGPTHSRKQPLVPSERQWELQVSEPPAHGRSELGLWSWWVQDICAHRFVNRGCSGVLLDPSARVSPCPPSGDRNERVTDLGHLGEEADGQGQGEAEGGKAHEALDREKHPRSGAQKSRPGRQTDVIVRQSNPQGPPSLPLSQPSLGRRPSDLAPKGPAREESRGPSAEVNVFWVRVWPSSPTLARTP